MGCDIYCCIEYASSQRSDGSWWDFQPFVEEIHLDRDYRLFALMGEGRLSAQIKPVCEPRGLPADLSNHLHMRWGFYINDDLAAYEVEGYCSRADAERWVDEGDSTIFAEKWVSDPDAHSESWLAAGELDEVLMRFRATYNEVCPEFEAIIAAMRVLDGGHETRSRLVFYFHG